MSKATRSQPPYTPQQAAARAKAGPKGQTTAGRSTSGFGSGGAAKIAKKGAFKPGLRAGVKGKN
jgi:hypothetical protein